MKQWAMEHFQNKEIETLIIPWFCVKKPKGVFCQGEHSSYARKIFLVPFAQEV